MPNIGGPTQLRLALLSSVVHFVILYGAPIWADALYSNTTYGATCQQVYRTVALRVARAYRTASEVALLIIAGIPAIDLLADERAAKYHGGVEDSDEKRPKEMGYTLGGLIYSSRYLECGRVDQ